METSLKKHHKLESQDDVRLLILSTAKSLISLADGQGSIINSVACLKTNASMLNLIAEKLIKRTNGD